MQPSARDTYFETQVMTASPLKLRLMLIEGAIRFTNQVQHYWNEDRQEEALESSIRAREIIGELMSSLMPERSELAKQMLPVYGYIFRTLTEAQLEHSSAKLADAMRVLGEERKTWSEVCEKFADIEEAPPAQVEIAAPKTVAATATPTSAAPVAVQPSFDSENMASPAAPTLPPAVRGPMASRLPAIAAPAAPPRGISFEA